MNAMNTVETQEEKNKQLRVFMETNKPVCAVHPACTLEWVDAAHSFLVGCPGKFQYHGDTLRIEQTMFVWKFIFDNNIS